MSEKHTKGGLVLVNSTWVGSKTQNSFSSELIWPLEFRWIFFQYCEIWIGVSNFFHIKPSSMYPWNGLNTNLNPSIAACCVGANWCICGSSTCNSLRITSGIWEVSVIDFPNLVWFWHRFKDMADMGMSMIEMRWNEMKWDEMRWNEMKWDGCQLKKYQPTNQSLNLSTIWNIHRTTSAETTPVGGALALASAALHLGGIDKNEGLKGDITGWYAMKSHEKSTTFVTPPIFRFSLCSVLLDKLSPPGFDPGLFLGGKPWVYWRERRNPWKTIPDMTRVMAIFCERGIQGFFLSSILNVSFCGYCKS